MGRFTLTIVACALLALLPGCRARPPAAAAPAIFDSRSDAPYTLSAGDRLRVIVFGQDQLSNSYAVDGSGHVALPLVGAVKAEGLTTAELARTIEARLRGGFLREPKVSVEIEAYRPFFILGEVTNAGQYPYVNGMTVQTAVAIAGGFTPRAARQSAELTRLQAGRSMTASVPIDMPMRPGDTILVRERFF